MISLGDQPKIISMAHTLGIHSGDRVEAIREHCAKRVKAIARKRPAGSIEELQKQICQELNITMIEVWSDHDIDSIVERFARGERDPAFGGLGRELTDETYATLIQCKTRSEDGTFRYVAAIDCRTSEKAARRTFSGWHEIAHVLTTVAQLQFPLHRSTKEKDAVEKLMDIIAGDIGFYEPLFLPVLKAELAAERGLTFAVVDRVRQCFCPTASMEATLNACAARTPQPVFTLQAVMKYKAAEERELASGQGELIPSEKPKPALRVSRAGANSAARARGLHIPKNMRVPAGSIISLAMREEEDHAPRLAVENLNWWRSSDGTALQHASVRVEALRIRDRVFAIVRVLDIRD
jgi:hypothetical protein